MTEAHYERAAEAQAKPIRALLFDKDGTLFDFHGTWSGWARGLIASLAGGDRAMERDLAAALDFDLVAARFRKTSPIIAGTLDVAVAAIGSVRTDLDEKDLRALLIREAAAVRPVAAAPLVPLLRRLSGMGYALGVATNDAEGVARTQLAEAGILDRFGFIAGYDSGHGAKPEAGMLLAFCAAERVAPAEIAMIGDSTHDLHAARAAGAVAIAVLTGPAEAADLAPHADAVLPSIADLPDWLAPAP